MMNPYQWLSEEASNLAEALPPEVLESVVTAFNQAHSTDLEVNLEKRLPNYQHLSLVKRLLTAWRRNGLDPNADAIGFALAAAGETVRRERSRQSIEMAWTGPESIAHPFRRTEQAVLQVIDQAKERILLVSYAVYRIPNIAKSLVDAAKRGVVITIVLETPNLKSDDENEFSNLEAMGRNVLNCARVYYWPQSKRPTAPWGTVAKLHIKCVTSDGEWLFLSSANMTKLAFSINMELGVLVKNKQVTTGIETHFKSLIDGGVLEPI
jgi:phosphatidylserine/phosphatidylglycerophosphate/cardiolipin synthase-like enzyme